MKTIIARNDEHRYFLLLILLLILISLLSIFIGPQGFARANTDLIFNYRLNRLLLAIMAGSSLAASGASLQALFRNPLADPHIFGVSGGAALGAAIVIAFMADQLLIAPRMGAIIGASIAFFFIFFFMKGLNNALLSHCLLVGILINALASAIITLLKIIMPAEKTQSLLFWLVGNFSIIDKKELAMAIPLWLIGLSILLRVRAELDILSFGTKEALLLGIDAKNISKLTIIANCLLVANVVSFAGMLGFLGLVTPHLVRALNIINYRFLLPISMITGAIILVFFDILSRLSFLLFSTEIPVGALCALILSPALFVLLYKSRGYEHIED